MKRKLSLLLAMVLAMTMVMGISVTAFAATRPAGTSMDEAACTEHPGADHFYSYENLFGEYSDMVEGILYSVDLMGMYDMPYYSHDDHTDCVLYTPYFMDGIYTEGWYYCDDVTGFFCPCSGHHGSAEPPKPTPKKSESAHVHNFKWQTITAPTKETDGLEGELCSCGAVRNTLPLSAYGYALNEYATPMINAAKAGQTITFDFGEWNSFPKSFMAKLVDKSAQNVTFVFHYKWNHVKQEITIPAGTPIDLNFDWYGPAKMAELYGAY